MARTPEEVLKATVANLIVDNAVLASQLEEAKDQIAKLEAQQVKPPELKKVG